MRTITARQGQTLAEISAELIDGRVSKAQSEALQMRIRELNPALGTGRIKAGTTILVPDDTGIKITGTKRANADPSDMLNGLFDSSMRETLRQVTVGLKGREAERAEITAAFKSPAFKRAQTADRELGDKAELAKKALAEDETADKALEATLNGMQEAARASIAKLDKLIG